MWRRSPSHKMQVRKTNRHTSHTVDLSSCKNLLSATQNPAAIADKLSNELSLGCIAGLFLEWPFPSLHISPLGLIPKKKKPGEFRLIHHLSFPRGDSINSCIPNDASVDDVVILIRCTGRGCALAKTCHKRFLPNSNKSMRL